MSVKRFGWVLVLAVSTLGVADRAYAVRTWTNGGGTSEWNDATNWTGGVPGPSSGQDALFDAASPPGAITVTGATPSTRHISWGSAGDEIADVGAFTYNAGVGGVINLRTGSQMANQASSAASVQTFNVDLVQAAASTWRPVGAGFVFNNAYNLGTGLTIAGGTAGTGVHPITFNGIITGGTGGLTKTNSGIVTMNGTASYAGTTSVEAGTLLVNGTHTGGGAYTIAEGATLGGNGSIGSTVNLDGIIAPGTSPGTLTLGGLALLTSTLMYELDAINHVPGSNINDLIDVNGLLDLSGGGVLNVSSGGDLSLGVYELMQFDSLAPGSDPSDLALGTIPLAAGTFAQIVIDGDSVNLDISLIPEPTTLALAVIGLTGLVFRRRTRRGD